MFRSKMTVTLPLDKYGEIIEFMFMHDDCVEFIDEIIAKHRQEQEAAKAKNQEEQSVEENVNAAETESADEVVHSDADSESA